MKLARVQLKNFRSIVDSSVVEIEDRVTVCVGKNEQGKTTFLTGLASFNGTTPYGQNDLPNHLHFELSQKKPAEIPVITLWLSPEPSDIPVLKSLLKEQQENVRSFKATKYFDGHKTYSVVLTDGNELALTLDKPNMGPVIDNIKKLTAGIKDRMQAHAAREGGFAPHLPQANTHLDQFLNANFSDTTQLTNLVDTLVTGLMNLPAQDAAIQEDVRAFTKNLKDATANAQKVASEDLLKRFENLIPKFLYHSALMSKIPNEVNVSDFVAAPEKVSASMLALCTVAGLSMQKLQELSSAQQNNTMRESYEDNFKRTVSGGINEYWTQETYTIHFRFQEGKMSVSISDSTYSPRIAVSDRSEGFQWYLSFFATILAELGKSEAVVLLLDNPGIELHADGQRDIKLFLEEKLRANTQVIYVTHSPAMVDVANLEQVRQIELKAEGTKIGKVPQKSGEQFDLLEPIRSAIGAGLASTLFMGTKNVLVEGAADKPILDAALSVLYADEKRNILVNGSLAEQIALAAVYQRAGTSFVTCVDSDDGGRAIKTKLLANGIPKEKIVSLGDILSDDQADIEIEDLISADLYNRAVNETYPDMNIAKPADGTAKTTKYYGMEFQKLGINFSKRSVSLRLKKIIEDNKADEETLENLNLLCTAIFKGLGISKNVAAAAKKAS